MEAARKWLELGHALGKQNVIDTEILGNPVHMSSKAISLLTDIQMELSKNRGELNLNSSHHPVENGPDFIPIAVDDMKVIALLVKIIVVYGLSPCLPSLAVSQLGTQVAPWILPQIDRVGIDSQSIQTLSDQLFFILKRDDDTSRQLLVSIFLPYILFVFSFTPQKLAVITQMFPSFHLYKHLLRLIMFDPNNSAAKKELSSMVISRKDAVLSLIEIMFRSTQEDGIDLSKVQHAVLLLGSPTSVPPVKYIESLGTQLYHLLTSTDALQSEIASLIVLNLAVVQPKLVGKLRNLIVEPFERSGRQVSKSLLALYRLTYYNNRDQSDSSFVQHLCDRLCISMWLLVVCTTNDGSIPATVLEGMASVIEAEPRYIVKIVNSLLIDHVRENLTWHIDVHDEPSLIDSISPSKEIAITQKIEDRIDSLILVFKQLKDQVATTCLIQLVQNYTQMSANPVVGDMSLEGTLSILLQAKTIERLTTDSEIKSKLFETPSAVVEFAYSIITPVADSLVLKTSKSPRSNLEGTEGKPNLSLLDIGDSDDDSDDEDDDTDAYNTAHKSAHKEPTDDHTMLDLALSLLGTAIMESSAENSGEMMELSNKQRSSLLQLVNDDRIPKQIRGRAGFCWELINEEHSSSKPLNNGSAIAKDVLKEAYGALAEPLVPSRAYGIHLISQLLDRHEISLEKAMDIFIRELGDEDSYIYLNALKSIETAGRNYDTAIVIDYIFPYIDSSKKHVSIETALRAREALTRLITPKSMFKVSDELVNILAQDITAAAKEKVDYRFRLSSASILGIIISQFPKSVNSNMQNVISDCALGILRHEVKDEDTSMRRSAVILCLEIVSAVNTDSSFQIPRHLYESLRAELQHVQENSSDTTLVEHCKEVLHVM